MCVFLGGGGFSKVSKFEHQKGYINLLYDDLGSVKKKFPYLKNAVVSVSFIIC